MKRNHIHLAPGKAGDSGVISGMRTSAEILIYIDMRKALTGKHPGHVEFIEDNSFYYARVQLKLLYFSDGILFYASENNVILTSGNPNGFLEPKYFSKAVNRGTGEGMNGS